MQTRFYSADDNHDKPVRAGAYAYDEVQFVGEELTQISPGNTALYPLRPTDIFIWTNNDASVTVAEHRRGVVTAPVYHEEYNIIHIPIPADVDLISVTAFTDLTVSDSLLLREIHRFATQPAMDGSKMVLNDRVSFSQTGKGHNSWSPPVLRLKFNFKNHPSPADAKFIRNLSLSREQAWCWPSGGYARGRDNDELPEWLAANVLRRVACMKHSFDAHAGSWGLGLDGGAEFYEPLPELTSFVRPAEGRGLCFLDGTQWCTVMDGQLVTRLMRDEVS